MLFYGIFNVQYRSGQMMSVVKQKSPFIHLTSQPDNRPREVETTEIHNTEVTCFLMFRHSLKTDYCDQNCKRKS